MKEIYGAGGGGRSRETKVKQPPKPVIAQDDASLKSISFAKIQFLLCEGDIEGPAEGNNREGLERSVYLDNTPIRVGTATPSPQPEDLVFSYGRPADQQSAVPDYNQTSEPYPVDTLCSQGNTVSQGLTLQKAGKPHYANVLLTFEALQMSIVNGDGIAGNTGDIRTYRVDYVIDYIDDVGVTRTPVASGVVGQGRVEGKFGSAFQRSHEFLLEGTAPWTVRVTRNTVNDDTFNPAVRVVRSAFNFSSVTLSYDDELKYPDSSVLTVGVRADNYDQIPNVSVDLKGLKVQIPSNATVDSTDGHITYTGTWDGTFKTEWTSDPAWCLRDLILNARYGAGEYINESFVDKWSLYQISQYCNEMVPSDKKNPDGSAIDEPRFSCNLLLQSSGEAWTVIQQFSSIFRGMVYYASSIAVAAQDREKDAIFTFNESNTIEQYDDSGQVGLGNFNYSGSARRARHTVCLVSYDDPEDNYSPRIEALTDTDGLAEYGYRAIDLRLIGVTSRSQALRAAEWTLLSETLLTDTIAFKTNEIGMALRPGDIVKIADPSKSGVRAGGRILGVVGNYITLDFLPPDPPGGIIGSQFSWMYNEVDAGLDGTNQPRLETATVTGTLNPGGGADWENAFATCITPVDPTAPYGSSDAGTYSSGKFISICVDPTDPLFDPGVAAYDNADIKPRSEIGSGSSNTIIIDGNGGHPPQVQNPYLLEFPSLSAQKFRILTVTQEEEGIFAITGLRYRDDIYDKVDFDTPLTEDKDYFYNPINPGPPTAVIAQVIWDNGQAKISVRWNPPIASTTLFNYNLEVRYYRIQWQSGTVTGGIITWSESWIEVPPQTDDEELIPIEELAIEDEFRVRIASVSRVGVQSTWSSYVTADRITTWFPMPDISTGSVLSFTNQSSGGQLMLWQFAGLALPPYITGVQLDVSPNRALTVDEKKGLKPPLPGTDVAPVFGIYIYGDYPLEEYAVTVFHADTNWDCRIHFLTAVQGLEGDTFASVTVTRDDIVPPEPDLFTVVTDSDKQSIAPMRRFSWALPTSEISSANAFSHLPSVLRESPSLQTITSNWPLGKVTDIVQFLIRYKAGFNNTWNQGVSLFADGVPGDQRFFETELFDSGTWTVMIRSVDKTGWVSDDQAAIIVNLGDAIPTNVVETFDPKAEGWPGQKGNCSVNSDGNLEQDDPTQESEYLFPFTVSANDAGLLVTTSATNDDPAKNGTTPIGSPDQGGTYQWFLREIGSDLQDPMYPDPQGDPMYPPPQTNYMYLDTNTAIGISFHPYVPFEKLSAGSYELGCRILSIDGSAKTILTATEAEMDYPDVERTGDDIPIDDSGNDRIDFDTPFPHQVKAVSVTIQDPDGAVTVPATAYLRGKDVNGFNIRLLDANGATVSGLIDYQAVGY